MSGGGADDAESMLSLLAGADGTILSACTEQRDGEVRNQTTGHRENKSCALR